MDGWMVGERDRDNGMPREGLYTTTRVACRSDRHNELVCGDAKGAPGQYHIK